MKHKLLIPLLLSCIPLASHAKVYMCEEEGKTTFSQTPCIGEMQVIEVKEDYSTGNEPNQSLIDQNREREVYLAIRSKKIMPGMTKKELIRSWGKPTKINSSGGSYGSRDQYVYRRGNNQTQYVYLEDGIISSWSNN